MGARARDRQRMAGKKSNTGKTGNTGSIDNTSSNPGVTQELYIKEVRGRQKHYRKIVQFTHSSTKAAAVMLVAAIVALIVANTGAYEAFVNFFNTELGVFFGDAEVGLSLTHLINDFGMALFFLLVGLEVKYEMTVGELSNIRQALLPILAAVGGVLMPIVIYSAFNAGNVETAHGWGVPTATDIAFALGILSLLGNRVPNGVRVFLSTLAVVDDIIAILVIAIFYGETPDPLWLLAAAVVLVVLILFNRSHIYSLTPYLLVGFVLWVCVYMSGIHSTIAGVLLAFTIPSGSRINMKKFFTWSNKKVEQAQQYYEPEVPVAKQPNYIKTVGSLSKVAQQAIPPATRLENKLYPWVYFLVLPLFALTNADVSFAGMDLVETVTSPVFLGVFLGLLVGKPLGILLMSFIVVKTGLSSLPKNVNWGHMVGASILGGVGFTMSIFVANLAFDDEVLISTAKLGILTASLCAGVIGFLCLYLQAKVAEKHGVSYISVKSDDGNLQTADREAVRDSEKTLYGDLDLSSSSSSDEEGNGVFEIKVDLGASGLLKGGSLGDVQSAIREEVLRVLREEGKDELADQVQAGYDAHKDQQPLVTVEEAIRHSDELKNLGQKMAQSEGAQQMREELSQSEEAQQLYDSLVKERQEKGLDVEDTPGGGMTDGDVDAGGADAGGMDGDDSAPTGEHAKRG